MSDFYDDMLKKSIERQAKDIMSAGATENDRYGNLLDSVKDRDLEQEETDRKYNIISNVQRNTELNRRNREIENSKASGTLKNIMSNVQRRELQEKNEIKNKYADRLKRAEENLRREQRNKTYFS